MLANNSEISDSYNAGKIATTTSGSTNGNYIAGGIAGYTNNLAGENTTISNCYNTGSVYGYTHTGGIQGLLQGGGKHNTKNCYSIGTISGNTKYGISGFHSVHNGTPQHIVSNNYWLSGTGVTYGRYGNSNTNAQPITDEILKTYANILGEAYVDDINNINNGYPILKWQVDNER